MKPLLPRMTLDEAAVAMTERTVDNWTARDILGAGARQEITIHAKIPIGMKMVRCEPIEAGPNETEMVAGVLFPLDSNTVGRLLVGPDVEVKELHGPKRIHPNVELYGTGPEWEIAEGETAPRVTASDCWIVDSSLERLVSKHSKPEGTPGAREAVGRSITKQQVIDAFEGLHFNGRNGWRNALSDVPQWIEPCRVTLGRKGDNSASATWNPVLIAAALIDKGIPPKKLDAVFVGLGKDWLDEWEEASASSR